MEKEKRTPLLQGRLKSLILAAADIRRSEPIAGARNRLLIIVTLIGWLTSLLNVAHAQNQQLTKQPLAQKSADEKQDLTGEIHDKLGTPVAKAKVLLIYKSWPGGRYRQDAFNTVSDKDGNFHFADLYSTTIRTAFLVTVLAEGQTMQSEYVLCNPNEPPKPFRFQLKPALDKAFVLHDENDQPLANAQVFPMTRKPAEGDQQFLIYSQSATAVARQTDANGIVRLPFFETGDTVHLQVVGSERITFVVDESKQQSVTVAKRQTASAKAERWAPTPVDVEESQVNWVRQHAVPFRLTDDDADDFSDLMPLKEMIGKSRIVQLGEQTHGDGACFQAKVRLIRFLHQQLGFDVLAFESGLYDCDRVNSSLRNGADPQQAVQQGVFPIWTGCSQTVPLWKDLAASYKTARPLELAGFDCQFTGQASGEHLVDDLKAIATKYHLLTANELQNPDWDSFFSQLQRLTTHQQFEGSKANWMKSFDVLIAGLEKGKPAIEADQQEWSFWRQLLRSVKAYAQYTISDSTKAAGVLNETELNGRDAQMADNLIWLADQRYPGRKIVVWAASFHIMRNAARIEVPDGSVNYASIVPMGHHVHQKLGKEVFTIAFTSAEGQAGLWFYPPFPIGDAPSGTLENICARAKLEHAVIPLRPDTPDSAWLSEKMFARPLGYCWMKARWSDHFDAVVFQNRMQPATAKQ